VAWSAPRVDRGDHRRARRVDHDDVADVAEVADAWCGGAGRDVEQVAAVDVVGQESWRAQRGPGDRGDGRDVGEDLGGGVASADDDDVLPAEVAGAAVVSGVELPAAGEVPAGDVWGVRGAPGSGGGDDRAGADAAGVGDDEEAVAVAVNAVDGDGAPDGEFVALLVGGEIVDDVVAGGERFAVLLRHPPAGERAVLRRREQV